ncbi:hypothetical protein C8R45DRAFT_934031 [Mycena sanguinolenta]|nr:hypothetical protein C8R45DRAFT_934031 [Mycena sanguinolenta]
MGTSCAPTYANLFLASFEGPVLEELKDITLPYRRHTDDTPEITNGTLQDTRKELGLKENLLAMCESASRSLTFRISVRISQSVLMCEIDTDDGHEVHVLKSSHNPVWDDIDLSPIWHNLDECWKEFWIGYPEFRFMASYEKSVALGD